MNYLVKGRKENRSEGRSHIARPKRGHVLSVTEILAIFLCINLKTFKMCLF